MIEVSSRALSRIECLALLETAATGQLALTRHALPTVVPARFVVRLDKVLVHLFTGLRPVPWRDGEVVALHVSHFDDNENTGWSVSIVGAAHGTPDLALDAEMPHAPWIAHGGGDLIALPIDLISGERLRPTDPTTHDTGADA